MISVPKRLRGFLADRPNAVAAVTKLFLDEIELLLNAMEGCCGSQHKPRPREPGRLSCRRESRSPAGKWLRRCH